MTVIPEENNKPGSGEYKVFAERIAPFSIISKDLKLCYRYINAFI